MNTPNNKRKKASQEKIEKTFLQLLQTKELSSISVTDICNLSKLNRTTFYANYLDIYDLADKIKEKLENDITTIYQDEITNGYNSNDFLKLFRHIKDNQLFYKTYFKLGFDNQYKIIQYDTNQSKKYFDDKFIDYHIEFFRNGLNSVLKLWLKNGCIETPEEINSIIESEYWGRNKEENF